MIGSLLISPYTIIVPFGAKDCIASFPTFPPTASMAYGNPLTFVILRANFLTSWILAVDELKIKPGEQLLVTAASSHLGRAMIQISKILGFKVVGTVRKEEQKQELLDMGAEDIIVTDTENFIKRARPRR